MRYLSLCGQILVTALTVLVSVTPPTYAEKGARTFEEKKWALQFGIRSDLTLGTFESGSVSFKQQLSKRSALRYGVTIHYFYSDSAGEYHATENELSVFYQRYVNPDAIAKFYWGTGPYLLIGYQYGLHKYDDMYDERIQKQWGAGWYVVGGVEWFVTDVISLHVEYRGGALYSWHSYRFESMMPNSVVKVWERDNSSFRFSNSDNVLFGLSVYF